MMFTSGKPPFPAPSATAFGTTVFPGGPASQPSGTPGLSAIGMPASSSFVTSAPPPFGTTPTSSGVGSAPAQSAFATPTQSPFGFRAAPTPSNGIAPASGIGSAPASLPPFGTSANFGAATTPSNGIPGFGFGGTERPISMPFDLGATPTSSGVGSAATQSPFGTPAQSRFGFGFGSGAASTPSGIGSAPAALPPFGTFANFGAAPTPSNGMTGFGGHAMSSTPAVGTSAFSGSGHGVAAASPSTASGGTTSAFSSTFSGFGNTSGAQPCTNPFAGIPFMGQIFGTSSGAQQGTNLFTGHPPPFMSAGFGNTQMQGTDMNRYRPTRVDEGPLDNNKMESISAMDAYKYKSHEELRFEDYKQHGFGGFLQSTQKSLFGPGACAPNPFLNSIDPSSSQREDRPPQSVHCSGCTCANNPHFSTGRANTTAQSLATGVPQSSNVNQPFHQLFGASTGVTPLVQGYVNGVIPGLTFGTLTLNGGGGGGSGQPLGAQSVNLESGTALFGFLPIFIPTNSPPHPVNSELAGWTFPSSTTSALAGWTFPSSTTPALPSGSSLGRPSPSGGQGSTPRCSFTLTPPPNTRIFGTPASAASTLVAEASTPSTAPTDNCLFVNNSSLFGGSMFKTSTPVAKVSTPLSSGSPGNGPASQPSRSALPVSDAPTRSNEPTSLPILNFDQLLKPPAPKGLELIITSLGSNPWEQKVQLTHSDTVGQILTCEDARTDPDIIALADFAVEQHNAMVVNKSSKEIVGHQTVVAACLEAVDGGRYHIVLEATPGAGIPFNRRKYYAVVLRKKTDNVTVLQKWVPGP